ncbi:unnamed protein product [Boreogadus saida]
MLDKVSTSKNRFKLKLFCTSFHVCLSVINLWESIDRDASQARKGRNATADATVEVQRYLTDPPISRSTEVLAGTSKCVHTFIQAGELIFMYASILCTIGANSQNVEKL